MGRADCRGRAGCGSGTGLCWRPAAGARSFAPTPCPSTTLSTPALNTTNQKTLESLQLSCCRRLAGVRLNCPQLRALALEECTYLEAVQLRSRHMTAMSLGTCPRLGAIAIECEAMEELDLRGCNQLASLQLGCPALRAVDATFCSSLRYVGGGWGVAACGGWAGRSGSS